MLVLPKASFAFLVISRLMASSALRFTPRVNPSLTPRKVLLGSFKGFRVLDLDLANHREPCP